MAGGREDEKMSLDGECQAAESGSLDSKSDIWDLGFEESVPLGNKRCSIIHGDTALDFLKVYSNAVQRD